MQHDQQQEESRGANEEPANPSSAAARLDIYRSIFAHEAAILEEKHEISNGPAVGRIGAPV